MKKKWIPGVMLGVVILGLYFYIWNIHQRVEILEALLEHVGL